MSNLFSASAGPFGQTVSPLKEMTAYEAMWMQPKASFKTIADKFRSATECLPSELVSEEDLMSAEEKIRQIVKGSEIKSFGVRVNGTIDYPAKLRDARNPVEILYYQGDWDLAYTNSVAVVGARKVTADGIKRTQQLVRGLVQDGYTVVSGLAEGVDTAAHSTALSLGGRTIAVIGTPLNHSYPKSNEKLQARIREQHLIISQVPFVKYESQDWRSNRSFFPERNITMSALAQATIIVEASDTSGTLYQARAALAQGRKLFILNSCFENADITWPEKYEKKGAVRVREYADIRKHLSDDQARTD